MAPTFLVTQDAVNSVSGEPHYSVTGPWDKDTIKAVQTQRKRFVQTIEAENLEEASLKIVCPACEAANRRLEQRDFLSTPALRLRRSTERG